MKKRLFDWIKRLYYWFNRKSMAMKHIVTMLLAYRRFGRVAMTRPLNTREREQMGKLNAMVDKIIEATLGKKTAEMEPEIIDSSDDEKKEEAQEKKVVKFRKEYPPSSIASDKQEG